MSAVGRHEMYGLTGCRGCVQILSQLAHRTGVGHTNSSGILGDGRLFAGPDDIIDGQFVTEDDGAVVVNIDDSSQSLAIQTEKVEKRGILTKLIVVVGIVVTGDAVTEEKQPLALRFQILKAL